MKKFNCFNILWDIDDDQDVFQSQLPRKMSIELDISNIESTEVLNDEIVEALTNELGLCVLEFDCDELESFKVGDFPDDPSQKEKGFSDDGF
tara:strand:+ start:431 stop:706 length:276 start_codon:yes stop_codon:yes gene_type:complete